MPQPDTNPQAIMISPIQQQSVSLRVDEQIYQEAREYLRAGLQGSANSHQAFVTDLKQYSAWCSRTGMSQRPCLQLLL